MMLRSFILSVVLVAAGACGDDGTGASPEPGYVPARTFLPDGAGSIIDGDWFICDDASCTLFESEGLRFAGGAIYTLRRRSELGLDGYCVDGLFAFYRVLQATGQVIIQGDGPGQVTLDLVEDGNTALIEVGAVPGVIVRMFPSAPVPSC